MLLTVGLCLIAGPSFGCNPGDRELIVDLRTDYLPGREFTVVTASIEDRTEMRTAGLGDDFRAGGRVAQFSELLTTPVTVMVRLLDEDGQTVATQRSLVQLAHEQTAVTVIVTRSCAGVDCSGEAEGLVACLGGRCVPEQCSVDPGGEGCPPAACELPSDCPLGASCSMPVCGRGVCFSEPRIDNECGSMQWCHPDLGCQGPADLIGRDAIAADATGVLRDAEVENAERALIEDGVGAHLMPHPTGDEFLVGTVGGMTACIAVAFADNRDTDSLRIVARGATGAELSVFGGPHPLPDRHLGTLTLGDSFEAHEVRAETPLEFALLCIGAAEAEVDVVQAFTPTTAEAIVGPVSTCPDRPAPVFARLGFLEQEGTACNPDAVLVEDGAGAGLARLGGTRGIVVGRWGTVSCVLADFGAPVPIEAVRVVMRASGDACGLTCNSDGGCGTGRDGPFEVSADGVSFQRLDFPDFPDDYENHEFPIDPLEAVRAVITCRSAWSAGRDHLDVDYIGLVCP